MTWSQSAHCNVCGKVRGASNHWILAVVDERGLTLYPWTDSDSKLDGMQHLCGRECVNRTVEKALGSPLFSGVPKLQRQ